MKSSKAVRLSEAEERLVVRNLLVGTENHPKYTVELGLIVRKLKINELGKCREKVGSEPSKVSGCATRRTYPEGPR